ncbi:uncharacterized protein [Temnothorax longispinosus]|uniref:uncharacterized protein n=1 Tax=Temnothorax longispinosus TaxID=300112 RepID=UPI003A994586
MDRGTNKRKHYLSFLDPDYRSSSVDPRTHKRWNEIRFKSGRNRDCIDAAKLQQDGDCPSSTSNSPLENHSEFDLPVSELVCLDVMSDDTTALRFAHKNVMKRSFGDKHMNMNDASTNDSDQPENPSLPRPSSIDSSVHLHEESNPTYYGMANDTSDDSNDSLDDSDEDIDNRRNFHDNLLIFPAAGITVSDVIKMTDGLSLRHRFSCEAQLAILELIKTLAGPQFKDWDVSSYRVTKLYNPPLQKISYTFYCSECNVTLLESIKSTNFSTQQIICDKCEKLYALTTESPNYFINLDIEYQIKLLLQREDVFDDLVNNLEMIENKIHNRNETICDVYDSETYKNLYRENRSNASLITFNFNTDGAPLFRSSKRSFWPIQITVNELSPSLRFKNTIVCSLWIGSKEPSPQFMNLYLNTFVKMILRLMNRELQLTTASGKTKMIIVRPLNAPVDSPARALVASRLQFNGHYGCSWCYAFGKHIDTMRYPMLTSDDDENPSLRTHDEYLKDAINAAKLHKIVRGVKGLTVLSKIPSFDCIWNFPLEYMHTFILGVAQQMWNMWISNPKHQFYLSRTKRIEINRRLLAMQPPHEIHRLPRSLVDAAKWKATEWRAWLLFYCYPCLKDVLDDKALDSFMLFSQSIYRLLQSEISVLDLKKCEIDLMRFVGETEIFYGETAMTFNVHVITHVVQSVIKCGPLWGNSTFQFENGIYICKQQLNGPKGVYQQMSKKLLRLSIFQSTCEGNTFHSKGALQFSQNLFSHRRLTKYVNSNLNDVVFIGEGEFCTDPRDCSILRDDITVKVYNRCIFRGSVYHSVTYTRPKKTNDTIILLKNDTVLQIVGFYRDSKGSIFIRGHTLIVTPIRISNSKQYTQFQEIVEEVQVPIIIQFEDIKNKMVLIKSRISKYVCALPNTFETQ